MSRSEVEENIAFLFSVFLVPDITRGSLGNCLQLFAVKFVY